MEFVVHPEIIARFPDLRLAVAVADGVDNGGERAWVNAWWRQAWIDAAQAAVYGNAQSHPRVRPWRERWRALGISGKEYPSSVEALLRRALKGGEPFRINPLVDFYNGVSLRHVVPAGGFDLGQIGGPLELRLTRDGDRFESLDAAAPVPVPPGEVAYADDPTVLTRHFVWRQARTGLIAGTTRALFLVSEILGEVEAQAPGTAEAVLNDFATGLRDVFGVDPRPFIVDPAHRLAAW